MDNNKRKGVIGMGFLKNAFKDAMKPRVDIKIIAGGHVLTDKELNVPIKNATLFKGEEKGTVVSQIPFGDKKPFTFKGISWEPASSRSAGKAAAGAIAGTLAAGPLGTIAGAAVGGKKKDESTAFLTLVDREGIEHEIHIECTKQQYSQIANLPYV